MSVRLAALIAAIALTIAPRALLAQSADQAPRDEFIMNAWSNPADCNRENARRVVFADLAAGGAGLQRQCVAVQGYWAGRALFGSRWDAKSRYAAISKRLRGKRIGLYANWEVVGEPPEKPVRTLFVGRVQQCETSWPNAIMVMGYCHYTGGPILLVSQAFVN